jgi:phosphate transport system permease protein
MATAEVLWEGTTLARARGRRVRNVIGWGLCAAAFCVLGGAMLWIVIVVLQRGFASLNWTVLTHVTEGTGGGLLNAIQGTALLALGGVILAVPAGLAAGLFLAEYHHGVLPPALRFLSDVLVGVPSIVVGYFAYVTLVVGLGWQFSLAAGSIALAIISLPYICRTTEMAVREVPNDLREAAYALGANRRQVMWSISLPIALPGILTGILLALAISVGETAPLIYTAGWSNYLWSGRVIREPVAYLTYAIWAFITEPFETAHALAYAAALFVTLFVLAISVAARVLLDREARWRKR